MYRKPIANPWESPSDLITNQRAYKGWTYVPTHRQQIASVVHEGIVLEVTYQSVSLKASSKTQKATAIKYTARAGKYGWGGNPSSRVQGK